MERPDKLCGDPLVDALWQAEIATEAAITRSLVDEPEGEWRARHQRGLEVLYQEVGALHASLQHTTDPRARAALLLNMLQATCICEVSSPRISVMTPILQEFCNQWQQAYADQLGAAAGSYAAALHAERTTDGAIGLAKDYLELCVAAKEELSQRLRAATRDDEISYDSLYEKAEAEWALEYGALSVMGETSEQAAERGHKEIGEIIIDSIEMLMQDYADVLPDPMPVEAAGMVALLERKQEQSALPAANDNTATERTCAALKKLFAQNKDGEDLVGLVEAYQALKAQMRGRGGVA